MPQNIERGVYYFFNQVNHKVYIGSSQNIKRRIGQHLSKLRTGRHSNQPFQLDWQIYGEESFRWGVLAHVDNGAVERVEQHYIDQYKSCRPEFGYNLSDRPAGSFYQRIRNWREKNKE